MTKNIEKIAVEFVSEKLFRDIDWSKTTLLSSYTTVKLLLNNVEKGI